MLRLVQQRSLIAQREAARACSRPAVSAVRRKHSRLPDESRSPSRSGLISPLRLNASADLHSSQVAQALSKFTMPAMSPTMTEGGIASWKKAEGESFAPGDVLVEIVSCSVGCGSWGARGQGADGALDVQETDKATMDVEAQDDGLLAKIIVSSPSSVHLRTSSGSSSLSQIGDGSKAIPVGTAVAILAEEGDDVSAAAIDALLAESSSEAPAAAPSTPEPVAEAPKAAEKAPEPTPAAAPSSPSLQPSADRPHILASPLAKRLALEQGIPLTKITGTGPGGRIVKADIEAYKPSAPTPSPAGAASAPSASKAAAAAPSAKYTDTPVSNMRRTIASRLSESKNGAPHYYLTVEVNMDRVTKLRELFNSAAKAAEVAGGLKDGVKGGVKLSVNDFIVKASALALQDVPEANSGWHGDFVRQCVFTRFPLIGRRDRELMSVVRAGTTRRTSRSPSLLPTASSLPS